MFGKIMPDVSNAVGLEDKDTITHEITGRLSFHVEDDKDKEIAKEVGALFKKYDIGLVETFFTGLA